MKANPPLEFVFEAYLNCRVKQNQANARKARLPSQRPQVPWRSRQVDDIHQWLIYLTGQLAKMM